MDAERLCAVAPGERAAEPDGDLEFLDDSATVGAGGLREVLHKPATIRSMIYSS